jgi:hypothetical protein
MTWPDTIRPLIRSVLNRIPDPEAQAKELRAAWNDLIDGQPAWTRSSVWAYKYKKWREVIQEERKRAGIPEPEQERLF